MWGGWIMSKRNKESKTREKIGLLRCYQNVFFMLGIAVRHTPVYFVNFCLFQIYCAAQVFFLTLDAFGIVFILASLAVMALAQSYIGRIQFARDAKLKPIERKRSYFNRIFYLNDYAKEIRLNPVAEQLKEEFSETNRLVYPIVKKYGKKNALAGFLGDFGSNDILINTVSWKMFPLRMEMIRIRSMTLSFCCGFMI